MPATDFSSLNGTADLLAAANSQTSGYFWATINFMIFVVVFITVTGMAGWEAGLITAAFVGLLISLFLTYLGLQAMWVFGVYVGLMIIAFIYIMWSNRYD